MSSNELFQKVQLSEAAYADFFDPTKTRLQALQEKGVSLPQARDLLAQWRVVADGHQPNTASGFAAMLFEKIGLDIDPANRFVFSIRGTAGLTVSASRRSPAN